MLQETARVVAIESDALWVETVQSSTCGKCSAKQGCGQSLLEKYAGKTSYLRVLLEGRDTGAYQINDEVAIAVPEHVVVQGSLLVYLTPLVGLLLGAGLGQNYSEGLSILGALLGLLLGGGLVRLLAFLSRDDCRVNPVLLDDVSPVVFTPSQSR